MSTPDIGNIVERFVDGEWRCDWCTMIRVERGKQFAGSKKIVSSGDKITWIKFGEIVWGTDLAVHSPESDAWRHLAPHADPVYAGC